MLLGPAFHQHRRAPSRMDRTGDMPETCFLAGALGALVFGMRIGANCRDALGEQTLNMHSNKCGAMALAEHCNFAYILIDPARTGRQVGQGMRIPAMHIIVLRECERSPRVFHDPHCNPRVCELFNFPLDFRCSPPRNHMRLHAPTRQQGKVGFSDEAKAISIRSFHEEQVYERSYT